MAQREPALVTPFWVRIATETNLSPGWLLIAFPAVLYPTYLVLEALFGRGLAAATEFRGDRGEWAPFVVPPFLGYLTMMWIYVTRGTLRDLKDLRPVLRGGEAVYAGLQDQLTRFERTHLWIGTLVALAITAFRQELGHDRWTSLLAGEWSLRDAWVAATVFAFWLTAGRGAVCLIDSARLYSHIGERQVTVNLLDLGPLSPLTWHGLRIVLLLAVMMAASGFTVAAQTDGFSSAPGFVTTFFLALLVAVGVAAAVFVFPVRGLRRHIRARKSEELAKIRADIRTDQALVAKRGPESAEASVRLPALLAFEKRIESVREWPFDAPTLTRFFLYVAIPLGSWVGGALVERLLGAALD